MKNKNLNIKIKLTNHLILNGKKNTSERILLKTAKELQKHSVKQFKKLIELSIVFLMPVFKLNKIINKTQKPKKIKENPVWINNNFARISSALKFVLANLNIRKPFYIKFKSEILQGFKKSEKSAILIKTDIQKKVLFKKLFFSYYKW